MPSLVAFTGFAGTGKSTAARHLAGLHKGTVLSFASPLRRTVNAFLELHGYSLEEILHFNTPEQKNKPIPRVAGSNSYRQLCQTLGTEWGRNHVAPDVWLNLAGLRTDKALQVGPVFIDDARFPNEIDWVLERGGGIIHLLGEPTLEGAAAAHSSESHAARILDAAGDDPRIKVVANHWQDLARPALPLSRFLDAVSSAYTELHSLLLISTAN